MPSEEEYRKTRSQQTPGLQNEKNSEFATIKNEKDPTTGQNGKNSGEAQSAKTPVDLNDYGGRRSIFKADMHKKYVRSLLKLQYFGRGRFDENAAKFQKMKNKLEREHKEFNIYVKESAQNLIMANNYMPLAVWTFMQDWLKKKKAILFGLPDRYVMKDIHYDVEEHVENPPVLKFDKHLLDVGMAPSLKWPIWTQKCIISTENIAPMIPSWEREIFLHQDPNIPALSGKYGAHFASGISALRCLMLWQGLKLTENCSIPVSVMKYCSNGEFKYLIALSKPLPPQVMSKRQTMNCWAKAGFLEMLKGTNKATTNSSDQVDTSDEHGPFRIAAPNQKSSGLRDKSLMDAEEVVQEPHVKLQRRCHSVFAPVEAEKSMALSIDFSHGSRGKGSPALENSSDFELPKKPNSMRQYHLFNLEEFNILVRSNVDGILANGNRASVSSKVEYQSMFGAEKQTNTEMIYDVLTGFLKNSDEHLRGHVKHAEDNDLVGLSVLAKDLFSPFCFSEIEPCQMMSNGMRRLHFVLSKLMNLPEGHYMLRFNAALKPERFEILQWKESKSRLDSGNDDDELVLKKVYESYDYARTPNVSTLDECWREIDPNVLLHWQRMEEQIPATFPPRKATEEIKSEQPAEKRRRGRPCKNLGPKNLAK